MCEELDELPTLGDNGFRACMNDYSGPEWAPVERAVEAGKAAGIPVMVDFGSNRRERSLAQLLIEKLRPGDIYTHVYSGLRGEQDPYQL